MTADDGGGLTGRGESIISGLRSSWRVILSGIVGLALLGGVEFLLVSTLPMPYVAAIHLGFVLGVGFIPIWGYVLMDAVPLLSPLLGKMVFTLAMMGNGTNVLNQEENDEYEMEYADETEWENNRNWTRLALSRFGVSYQRSAAAFGSAVKEYDFDTLEDVAGDELSGNRIPVEIERADFGTFVRADIDPDAILVAIGEKLAEFRDSAGIDVANRAQIQSLKDHGGDSGSHSTAVMALATLAFAILGAGVGYVLLFGVV